MGSVGSGSWRGPHVRRSRDRKQRTETAERGARTRSARNEAPPGAEEGNVWLSGGRKPERMGFFTTRFVEVASVGITYRSCPRRAEGRNVSGPHLPARQAQEVEEVVAPGSG